jgi:hypothetical protein
MPGTFPADMRAAVEEVRLKKRSRNIAKPAQATLEAWERTLEFSDDLSRYELLALLPEVEKALSTSIERLLKNQCSARESRKLTGVLGKILSKIEYRMKNG